MTILPVSRTPTVAVRAVVVALAFSIPLAFGVWNRLLSPEDDRPTPTATTGQRLVAPTVLVPYDPSYAFLGTQVDRAAPIAFDPCRPISYVTRDAGAPEGSADLVNEAVSRISAATGLQFIDEGSTDEQPETGRENFLPDRYGDRWAPVLIAWSTPDEYAGISGPVIGETYTQPVDVADHDLVLVSGEVVLDAAQITDRLRYVGGENEAIAVITHELGHLVGLGHVNDEHELMYPSARPLVTGLGQGDLTGLAALGGGRCYDSL